MKQAMHRWKPLLWALAMPALLLAQESAQISGVVRDPSDALVTGAAVTALNKDTGAERTVTTNAEGLYALPALNPGRYQVRAAAKGFRTSWITCETRSWDTIPANSGYKISTRLSSTPGSISVTNSHALFGSL